MEMEMEMADETDALNPTRSQSMASQAELHFRGYQIDFDFQIFQRFCRRRLSNGAVNG